MKLYNTIMRGFDDRTLNYSERAFLFQLSNKIQRLEDFDSEVKECSRPFDYGVMPRFEMYVIRMFERGCAQYLKLCGMILQCDDFDEARAKYRLSMPKMTDNITYPYLRFSWGYLDADRTSKGLQFKYGVGGLAFKMRRWKEDAFRNLKRRKAAMQYRDPMFPWRMYDYIWDIRLHTTKQLKERDMQWIKTAGKSVQATRLHRMSSLTRHAAVRMLLCAVKILDEHRRKAIAGKYTSKDTTIFLNHAWMLEKAEGFTWSGDKRKYYG